MEYHLEIIDTGKSQNQIWAKHIDNRSELKVGDKTEETILNQGSN